jgi:hypothetical protein
MKILTKDPLGLVKGDGIMLSFKSSDSCGDT